MLLRHRVPGIAPQAPTPMQSFRHLDDTAVAVLRWLADNRVDFVLVGPVARAIRGDSQARGPVSVVPAPYGRNLDRLARALTSEHARVRVDVATDGSSAGSETSPVKLTAEILLRAERWTLRCGSHDVDVEGRPSDSPRYQELLYEAARFEIAPSLSVEVAAPEDIEHYDHVRRTGSSPEIRISRAS
jgi:hypothetical protein